MTTISRLVQFVNGVARGVDLSANTVQVGILEVGSTNLTETILGRLISLQNGTDVGTAYHTHDTVYTRTTALAAATGTVGSTLIGDDNTYSNFTPAAATVKGALSGIDSALASAAGANKTLSNLTSPTSINQDLLPSTDNARALGSPTQQWEYLYVGTEVYTPTIASPVGGGAIDLTNSILNSTFGPSVNWQSGALYDTSTAQSLDFQGRSLLDNSSVIQLQWDATGIKFNTTTASTVPYLDASNYLVSSAVTPTELGYVSGVTSAIQTQLGGKLSLSGGTMTGAINMGSHQINALSDPTSAQDAATKAYVDSVALGLKPKSAVRVATTGSNVVIATGLVNGTVIDGITLATGDRVLLKDQTAPAENGIYIVAASGAASRSTDFNEVSPVDEINGAWLPVQLGTVNAGRVYVEYSVVATLGTDAINFEFYNPIAGLIGGDMITVSGSTISVDLATVSGLVSTNPGNAAGQLSVKLEASNPTLDITGSNELAVKLDGARAITTGASGIGVNVDGSTIDIATNAIEVKAAGITATQLASAAVTAAKLGTVTDGVTLDQSGSGSTIEVKTGGIGTTQLAAAAVTAAKLGSVTDGVTLDQSGSGSTIEIKTGGVGTTQLASAAVTIAKLGTITDGVTLDQSGSGSSLEIKSAGVGTTQLASQAVTAAKIATSAVDGVTITGGNGTALSVVQAPAIVTAVTVGASFSANTSYVVRWALSGETAGRVYAADLDATSADHFHAVGVIQVGGSGLVAGNTATMYRFGPMTLGSSDSAFVSGDIGKPVYLQSSGAFSTTVPSAANSANVIVGYVETTTVMDVVPSKILGVN
jgi:hypothetical protein